MSIKDTGKSGYYRKQLANKTNRGNQVIMSNEKTKTINIRTEEAQKQFLNRVAILSGQNLSNFMLESATKEAERRMEKIHRIEVTLEDMKNLIEAIENPGEPNEKLLAAASRFKNSYRNGEIEVDLRRDNEAP